MRHSSAFTKRWKQHVVRAGLICFGLGIGSFLLWWCAENHEQLSQTLADPAQLPAVLSGIAIVVALMLWKLPELQAAHSPGLSDENRFDRENEARKTLAQIIGGVFVLAGLYTSLKTFDLQLEGQITDRFTKAIEQLGALEPGGALDNVGRPKINLAVRLGGIYALERIAHDSPRDRSTIIEVLTSYVRANSPRKNYAGGMFAKEPDMALPTLDIQAIVAVIGRRDAIAQKQDERLDLHMTYLAQASLLKADLRSAYFYASQLEGAVLIEAHLEGAIFDGADLMGANLSNAHLEKAFLRGARLEGTLLHGAHLEGADLSGAIGLTKKQIDSAYGHARTK